MYYYITIIILVIIITIIYIYIYTYIITMYILLLPGGGHLAEAGLHAEDRQLQRLLGLGSGRRMQYARV